MPHSLLGSLIDKVRKAPKIVGRSIKGLSNKIGQTAQDLLTSAKSITKKIEPELSIEAPSIARTANFELNKWAQRRRKKSYLIQKGVPETTVAQMEDRDFDRIQVPRFESTIRGGVKSFTDNFRKDITGRTDFSRGIDKFTKGVRETGSAIKQDFSDVATAGGNDYNRFKKAISDYSDAFSREAQQTGGIGVAKDLGIGVLKGAANLADEISTGFFVLASDAFNKIYRTDIVEEFAESMIKQRQENVTWLAPDGVIQKSGSTGINLASYMTIAGASEKLIARKLIERRLISPVIANTLTGRTLVGVVSDLTAFAGVNALEEYSDGDFDTEQWIRRTITETVFGGAGSAIIGKLVKSAPNVVRGAFGSAKEINNFVKRISKPIIRWADEGLEALQIRNMIRTIGKTPTIQHLKGQDGFIINPFSKENKPVVVKLDENTPIREPKEPKPGELVVPGSTFELPAETMFQKLRRRTQDLNIRLKVLGEEIQKVTKNDLPEHLDLWAKKDMLPRLTSRAVQRIEDLRTAFVAKSVSKNIDINNLDEYLKARHAPERNAKMKELGSKLESPSGMSDKEAARIIASVEASGRKVDYDELAKDLKIVTDDTLDFQVGSGLLSKEDATRIKKAYENYIPLGRDVDDDFLGVGRGVDIKGKEIKRAKGSERGVLSPTSQIFRNAQKALTRNLKNNVGKGIIKMVDELPFLKKIFNIKKQRFIPRFDKNGELQYLDPQFKLGDNIIGVKVEGKQVFIEVKDKKIARALKATGMAEIPGWMRGIRSATALWSSLATRFNPEFVFVTNLQRDITDALVTAKSFNVNTKGLSIAIIKDIRPSQKSIWRFVRKTDEEALPSSAKDISLDTAPSKTKEDELVKQFFDDGGDTGHFWLQDSKKAEKSIFDLQKELQNNGWDKVKNPLKKSLKFIDDLNSTIELGTRFSAYKQFLSRGMSRQRAVQAAADLTVNFSRQGELMPALKSFYAFINPTIQGAEKSFRILKNKKVRRAMAGIAGIGFLNRLIQDQLGDDDIPDWVKNRQLAFQFPEEFPLVGGKQISLWNMGYGVSVPFALGGNTYDLMVGKKTSDEAGASLFEAAATAYSPIELSLSGAVPTLMKPLYEISKNENFAGANIHPRFHDLGVVAKRKSDTGDEKTSDASKFLTEIAFKISGGRIDIFPDDIDHLYNSYTTGAGKFVTNTFDVASSFINREEVDQSRIPLIRKFIRPANTSGGIYNDIFSVLEIADKREVDKSQEDRFFDAIERGEKEGAFDFKRANEFRREYLKAQNNIPNFNTKSPDFASSMNTIRNLPEEKRSRVEDFINESSKRRNEFKKWELAESGKNIKTKESLAKAMKKESVSVSQLYSHRKKVEIINGTDPKTIAPKPKGWREGNPIIKISSPNVHNVLNFSGYKKAKFELGEEKGSKMWLISFMKRGGISERDAKLVLLMEGFLDYSEVEKLMNTKGLPSDPSIKAEKQKIDKKAEVEKILSAETEEEVDSLFKELE